MDGKWLLYGIGIGALIAIFRIRKAPTPQTPPSFPGMGGP